MNDTGLAEEPDTSRRLSLLGFETAGQDAGAWCAFGNPLDAPPDQRAEDGLALSFTSRPLPSPLEILGHPVANLVLSADRALALVVVRLCEVWPDGASSLITRGALNLTHRNSHELLEPLRPGERFSVEVPLQSIGQVVPAGHRLRVAVSPTYFPWLWPSPEPVTLTLHSGESSIDVPLRGASQLDGTLEPFGPPEVGPELEAEILEKGSAAHTVTKDPLTGRVVTVHHNPGSRVSFADGLSVKQGGVARYEITEGDPLSARYEVERTVGFNRGQWDTELVARNELSCDATKFSFASTLLAYEAGTCFFERAWTFDIPRDFV